MRCPRCGEDNLPGLPACLACGRDLSAGAAVPAGPTVPRARAANPLAPPRRPRPRRRPALPAAAAPLGALLAALAVGMVPGLGPLRRGRRRLALLQVGALLAAGAAWLLLWRSAAQPLAWMAALTLLASFGLAEARARAPRWGPLPLLAAGALSLALVLTLHVVVALAFDAALPRVALPGTAALPGGHYLVERVALESLAVGELVAVGEPDAPLLLDRPTVVGPVLALPGQRVESDALGLRVDGEPAAVHPVNPGVAPPRLPAGGRIVPEGRVAVLVAPIRFVRPTELVGRLYYRWLPQAERGPLRWPPPPPEEP